MESILARALEYTLKYWLKSFSRDQFKLQGRTVQLSNLDMDGDALHSSLGLPPAINVTTAKVGKLEIVLPSVSNVQVEPIVMQIDRLDLVLEENSDPEASSNPNSPSQTTSSQPKGSGYGFADKIADGMTVEVGTVNLLLETRGGARQGGGASWTPPMASITVRGLTLYTTNENWQVVNLKEARESSSNKNFIYVFKKLEWESLSVDLLPHPDMFLDTRASASKYEANNRDDDGAKRAFFGGERFLEGISGEAHITLQRTTLNDPLGLEVRLHINEAVCPALSEPGLRALLRFLTGIYVCLNREDVDPKSQQRSTEAAGCSLISIAVEHLFFCIKDMEFRLELLMQSLFFSRASVCSGADSRNVTEISVGGLFLRDTFSHPPCTLIQPAIQSFTEDKPHIPDFAEKFCPPIYPLEGQQFETRTGVPFLSLHTLQVKPTPSPPLFASQTAICCQPLILHLQENSCLRISSFLADGIAAGNAAFSPEYSVNSLKLNIKELDMIVPLEAGKSHNLASNWNSALHSSFGGARLNIQNLFLFESPCQKMSLLDLEKDPACFCLWQGQPIDASQKKSTCGASSVSLSLETIKDLCSFQSSDYTLNLWKCIELKDACIEVAMATADGRPLICVPPPGGIVRVGVACKQYASNTSVEQFFFVLDLYEYFESVSEKITLIEKGNTPKSNEMWSEDLMSKAPSDTAMCVSVKDLQLRFLEDSSTHVQGKPLAQFNGEDLYIKVTHRTLGGAVAISSNIMWETVEIDCVDAEVNSGMVNSLESLSSFKDAYPELRAVLWVQNGSRKKRPLGSNLVPFLDLNMIHVVPFDGKDTGCHSLSISACIAGIRLGGGMNYAEALLQQFGILGPDGRPGEGLSCGMKRLSNGPLSKIFKPSPLISDTRKEYGTSENSHGDDFLSQLGHPDDVDISINLKDWLFALEGAQDVTEMSLDNGSYSREERCWHSTFKNLRIKAKNNLNSSLNGVGKSQGVRKYPVDFITVGVEGLQTLKPQIQMSHLLSGSLVNGSRDKIAETSGGVNLEARMVVSEDDFDFPTGNWEVEKLKFSVEQPIEAVITKDELQHLASLGKTEVESMGRIAAGILRVLKLEGTIGDEAINQLCNLGRSGSLDKIFNAAKLSNGGAAFGSTDNASPASPRVSSQSHRSSVEAVVTSLKEEISYSQAKCADLLLDVSASESSSRHIDQIQQLEQKLQNMQNLLKQLRFEK